ncbi:hypothetical protein [Acinetobacter baumannii]|uniref:hypothetical protein n=1 Tax=Acinetobacter baumannii TaxID=470 RepID=UPI003970E6C6
MYYFLLAGTIFFTMLSLWSSFDFLKYWGLIGSAIGAFSSLYIFIFRQHKMLLMKSIKSINDLMIKNNEKFIDAMLHDLNDNKGKTDLEKDRKKVSLYLTFIKVEIDNFPIGGPISSYFKNNSKNKKIKQKLNQSFSDYQETITLDTLIENPSMQIELCDKEQIIDKVIHHSKKISNELEQQLKLNI